MTKTATIQPASGSVVIGSKEYPITASVQLSDGTHVPLADIPQMSDERWHELSKRSRHAE